MEALDQAYENRTQIEGWGSSEAETLYMDVADYGDMVRIDIFGEGKDAPNVEFWCKRADYPNVPGNPQEPVGLGSQAEYVCVSCGRPYNDPMAYTDHVQGLDGLACPVVNEA